MGTGPIKAYKLAIAASLALLVLFLGLMLMYLPVQLRELATAQGDVTQWSISQLDTEYANLDAALSQRIAGDDISDDDIRLRVDIALSRVDIVTSGISGRLLDDQLDTALQLDFILTASERLAAIVDRPGPISERDLRRLRSITRQARPAARRIAIAGMELGVERTERSRDKGLRALSITGTVATALLILLVFLILLLNALLSRAAQRDADLSRSARRLSATVEASMDAVVTTDDDGRIVAFNTAAEQVFGWSRKDASGHLIGDLLLPPDDPATGNSILDLKQMAAGASDISALRRTGEDFPIELKVTQVEGRDGAEYIFYFRDISARRIADQALIDARDRAERTDTAKSRFVAVMSHEMRTPLNGILGVLDLLRKTPLTEQQARYAGIASASSEILLEQVNEALDITRIETGSLLLGSSPFGMVALIEGVVAALTPLAEEKGLCLTAGYRAGLPEAFCGDGGRIRQILTNLVGNAIKFTDSGSVSVTVTGMHGPVETALEFTVRDTGSGISPDDQERIFEDFFAQSPSKGRQRRSDGLGLSISRRIARQMGGDLFVRSAAGEGSSFVLAVSLPRVAAPKDPIQRPGPRRRILMVEDNDINRGILGDMLRGLGHHVVEAADGAKGVTAAEADAFDLILMDISMPVMGGIAATRTIRAGPGPNARTRIIALTAHGQEEYRGRAREAGMDGFETKPVRLPTIERMLSADVSPVHAHVPADLAALCDALGPDRAAQIGQAFFDQLDALAPLLSADPAALEDEVHKAKGAAALLGLFDIERMLAAIEDSAAAGKQAEIEPKRLRAVSTAQRTAFARAVAAQRDAAAAAG